MGGVQRRDLQLPASCARSSRPRGHVFRTKSDTEVLVHALRGVRHRRRSRASTGCSRSRSGTRPPHAASSSATASARSRSSTVRTRAAPLRLRAEGPARVRPPWSGRSTPARCTSTSYRLHAGEAAVFATASQRCRRRTCWSSDERAVTSRPLLASSATSRSRRRPTSGARGATSRRLLRQAVARRLDERRAARARS